MITACRKPDTIYEFLRYDGTNAEQIIELIEENCGGGLYKMECATAQPEYITILLYYYIIFMG